jgi:ABC-type multidrug transport system fused ATPase/permease subunit
VLRGTLFGTTWMIGLAVRPFMISKAVDDGLRPGDIGALAGWCVAIVLAGIALAWLSIMRHRTMTFVREDATARSGEVLLGHLSRTGAVLSRKVAAGEVATVSGTDISNVSQILTMTGPGVGAVLAYVAITALLWTISPVLAVTIALGVPTIVLATGPLFGGYERAESVYRQRQGGLTTRASDIVGGLRVLAGVGGRDLFGRRYAARSQDLLRQGYRVGAVSSWIDALVVVIPGLFLAAVVWLAARMAAHDEISVGQLVAVYGYVAALMMPIYFLLGGSHDFIRGRVSARRIIALLNLRPDHAGPDYGTRPAPSRPADLYDPESGLRVRDGELLAVTSGDSTAGAELADRLGRFTASEASWGGVRIAEVALDQVRSRILVADHDSYVFAGELRQILTTDADDDQVHAAVHAASAEDVVDSLPDGLASAVGARGRTLSGGQRQRVRLARALLAEPDVLILLDPTSAVDAHTEARIADRLRSARAGRTTIVVTSSPLLLGRVDRVVFLHEGLVAGDGTHAELLATLPEYRALVARESDEEVAA